MTTRRTTQPHKVNARRARQRPDLEAQKLLYQAIADSLARVADDPPTRAMLEAAELVLTGARAHIGLGDRPYFHLATAEELERCFGGDERDRLLCQMVETMFARVRIERAVVTEGGKLALRIELCTETEPGDAEDK